MKRKLLAGLITLTMTAALLAGCGSSSSDDSSEDTADETDETEETEAEDTEEEEDTDSEETADASDSEEEIHIQMILKTLASEYWSYVEAGAVGYTQDHPNVTVDVIGATSDTAYDEQQNMIETALTSGGYDGIIIAPLQSETADTLVSGTDIPIVAVDTSMSAEECLTFVGTGNEEAAYEGAQAAVELAKEAGWEEIYAINISAVQGNQTHTDRSNGFQAGIEDAGGIFLEDETQYSDGVADKAVTCMEAIMETHPEGVAIILCNNDDAAIAAARAASEIEAYENTIFVGFDGIMTACESILEGVETMSVAQEPYQMGYKSVEAVVAAINGEELEDFIDTGCSIITEENAQEQYDLLSEYLESVS